MTLQTTTPPRNTERCLQCGYLLCGLPDAGNCPECGQAYDQCQIIIEGCSADAEGRPVIAFRSILSGLVILLTAVSLGTRPSWLGWLAVATAVAMVICGLLLARRRSGDVPPLQLVLTQHGYLVQIHPDARGLARAQTFLGWIYLTVLVVLLAGRSLVGSVVMMAIYAVAILIAAVSHYRRRRPRASFSLDRDAVALTAWRDRDELVLQQERPGEWVVTVGRGITEKRFFTLSRTVKYASLEASLSDQRIEHLARQLADWPLRFTLKRKP